ncbi:class I SAM-dependent methyltransferase [Vibrio amylolyticus]|uniref:class I SAM-dependent methyltransferase n=1 Tax=Vibrio amylolyticus TaxID=2847292 RepID=UPI00354B5820
MENKIGDMMGQLNLDKSVTAYNKESPYDLDNSLMLSWYPKRVAKKMNKGSLLELGLGHGYSCREFSKHIDEYVVLDGSPAIIEKFRSENPDLNFVDIIETYFENFENNGTYDNIVMGFVLEHVNDPLEILLKYKDMLSENGRLFISVPNATSLHRQLANISGLLPDMYKLSPVDHEMGHMRYFDVDTLSALVEKAGLKIECIEGLLLKPFTTQQLTSLNLDEDIFQALLVKGIDYPELCTGILIEAKLK